jgi:tetratricopeptide (TPR) repeat protein
MNKKIKYIISLLGLLLIFGCSSAPKEDEGLLYLLDDEKARLNYIDTSKSDAVTKNHIIDGSNYQQKGNHARAILEFQDALKRDSSATIYYAMAKSYREIYKYDNAIKMVLKAIDKKPDFIPARELLAEIFIVQYRLSDAIKIYESILKYDPPNKRMYRLTLAHMYEFEDTEKALEIYEDELQNAEDYSILLRLSLLYEDNNDKENLIRILNKMIKYQSDNVGVHLTLFDEYLDSKDYHRAFKLLDEADRSFTDNETEMFYGLIANKLLAENADTSKKYIPIYLDRIDSRFYLNWRLQVVCGYLADIVDDTARVKEFTDRALLIGDSIPDASLQIGYLYLQREDFGRAIDIFEEYSEKFPDDYIFPFSIGLVYLQLDSAELSLEYFHRANWLEKESVDNLTQLGLVHDRLGNTDSSDHYYERALLIDPDDPLTNNNYAYSLSVREINLDQALEMINIALEAQPNNTSFLDTYGWIQYKLGNYDEAIEYIEKAASADDATAEVFEHLGDIYLSMGDEQKAIESWERGLERFPDDQNLSDKLKNKN